MVAQSPLQMVIPVDHMDSLKSTSAVNANRILYDRKELNKIQLDYNWRRTDLQIILIAILK